MTKLTAIEFENFKCFQHLRLPLGSITLLTGINGTGKSTVLQGLMLLRQSEQQGMLREHGLLLNGPLLSVGTAQDVLYEGAGEDAVGLSIDVLGQPFKWRFDYRLPEEDVLPVKQAPDVLPTTALFTDDVHYLSADRLGPRAFYELSTYEIERRRDIGSDGRFAVGFLDRFASKPTAEAVHHPDAADTLLRSQISAWMSELSPGAHVGTGQVSTHRHVTLNLGFTRDRATSRAFTAPNVGFGLSYVLPVLVGALGSDKGGLLMVENPEAHLHPRGQVALGELLARVSTGGVQVIVETHSDHLLNGVRLAVKRGVSKAEEVAIAFFDRIADGEQIKHTVHTPTVDENGRIDRWPPGFFDEWEKSLDDLLG